MCDFTNQPGGREAAMTVIQRDADGKPTVWCDPCMAPLVTALNDAGMRTIASCCGHGRNDPSVALDDGRWVTIASEPPVSYEYRFHQSTKLRLASCECGHARAVHVRRGYSCVECDSCGHFRRKIALELTEEEQAMLEELRDSPQGWRANYGNAGLAEEDYQDTPGPGGTVW